MTSKGGRDGSEYKINMFDLKCKTDRILKNNKSDKSEKRIIVLMITRRQIGRASCRERV